MAAHAPRRAFAQSFVVTLAAAAALPACKHDTPIIGNPPAPTDTPTASATAATIPSAAPSAGGHAEAETWTLSMSSGACEAMLDVSCPAGERCNPPPPQAYPCPKDVAPSAYPLRLSSIPGSPSCKAELTEYGGGGNCPPDMHCNPPPPRQRVLNVPCPK